MQQKAIKLLAGTFFLSGVWDVIAGILYFFCIGTGRPINTPSTDPFYAMFLGSFFFCFAYLQFISSFNIIRYGFIIGCLVFGRITYIVLLYYSIFRIDGFPNTFWFTGIIDSLFTIFYFWFSFKAGLKMRDLFLPQRN